MNRSAIVLLGLLQSVASLGAQAAGVDGRRLPLGTDTFNVSYGGTLIGRGITALSRVQRPQGEQLLQVYRWVGVGGDVIVDSLFSDPVSLRSLREVRVVADTVIEVLFGTDTATITMRPRAGAPASRSIAVERTAYSSAILDAVVAASPLSATFEAQPKFLFAPPSDRGVVTIGLRVTGSERVRDRAGAERDAWIVSAATPGGGTVFWVDKQTRSVLKYDTREGDAVIEFRR